MSGPGRPRRDRTPGPRSGHEGHGARRHCQAGQGRRASGVDAVIASGHEGGGHVGRIGTMVLVPRVVDQVRVPVIAAGGLADGRGLVAALALGAVGVWMGTRFIATAEARGHENYKRRITEIDEDGTAVTRAHSGKPNRMIRNDFTKSWEGRETEIKPYPLQLREVGEQASYRGDRGGSDQWGPALRPVRLIEGRAGRRGGRESPTSRPSPVAPAAGRMMPGASGLTPPVLSAAKSRCRQQVRLDPDHQVHPCGTGLPRAQRRVA